MRENREARQGLRLDTQADAVPSRDAPNSLASGRVAAESAGLGQGTTFRVALPLARKA